MDAAFAIPHLNDGKQIKIEMMKHFTRFHFFRRFVSWSFAVVVTGTHFTSSKHHG
jgi:hypothetical protein